MKKRLFTFIALLLLWYPSCFASWHKTIPTNQQTQNRFNVKTNPDGSLRIVTKTGSIEFISVQTPGGEYVKMVLPGYSWTRTIGSPELPYLGKMIEIPEGTQSKVQISHFKKIVIDLNKEGLPARIIPAQASLSKSDDPSQVPFILDQKVYSSNDFYKEDFASVSSLGRMRGVNLGRLNLSPFAYNPVSNILEVYTEMELLVQFVPDGKAVQSNEKQRVYSPVYDQVFSKLINYKPEPSKELITIAPLKYVIVSDRMFEPQLEDFVYWKTKKGFNVQVAYTDDPAVGNTTSSIKSYLQNLYTSATPSDPAPSFVLLVGDVQQIPAFAGTSGSHVTDLYYFTYDGTGDIYPECYYGRFSAQNPEQLQPQIDKTLEYEQYLMPDPSFLAEVVLIAGVDASMAPTYGNGQINYGTSNYFNLAHGITSHTYLYPASASSAAQIISDVSNGVAYANYTAHCSQSGWGDPSFTTSDVPGLQNNHQYPLMVGNCCLSVKFEVNECFGEAVLRAENKGALGYIGGSNSTYWNEDYWWGVGSGSISANPSYAQTGLGAYDGVWHDNGEALVDWYVTNGQMVQAGDLAVTEANGAETYYWEIYHLMGDPSVSTYMGIPSQLSATHLAALPLGSSSLSVTTEENAYIGLSMDSVLIAAGIAGPSGLVNLSFPALTNIGTMDIVVTKQNRAPYINTINVISANAPFVVCTSAIIDDSNANNNGFADFSENIQLDIDLNNLGMIDAHGVYAILSCSDTCISILNDSVSGGFIANSSSISLSSAFGIQIGTIIPDEHVVLFTLDTYDSTGASWQSNFTTTLYAPKPEIENISFTDTAGGNGNMRFDPGEIIDVAFSVKNSGHAPIGTSSNWISSTSQYLQILGSGTILPDLLPGQSEVIHQLIFVDAQTPLHSLVSFTTHTLAVIDPYYSDDFPKDALVGVIAEDWESQSFTSYNWLNNTSYPWTIDNNESFDGVASSRSGAIGNNQSSALEITIDVLADDSIHFYKKVSCEPAGWSVYDNLEFFIDNTSQGQWDGEIDWSHESYPVSTGTHTFKWVYSKDQSVAEGQDCAWIDFIEFPAMNGGSVNQAPVFTSSPIDSCYKYQLYSYNVTASDPDLQNLTLSCIQKPDFLSFTDNGDNTGVLTGTPGQDDAGTYSIVISANDGIDVCNQVYSLEVLVPSNISDFGIDAGVSLQPNPATNKTMLAFTLLHESEISINLYNASGQFVKNILLSERLNAGENHIGIGLQNLSNGVYFIELISENENLIQRLIKNE